MFPLFWPILSECICPQGYIYCAFQSFPPPLLPSAKNHFFPQLTKYVYYSPPFLLFPFPFSLLFRFVPHCFIFHFSPAPFPSPSHSILQNICLPLSFFCKFPPQKLTVTFCYIPIFYVWLFYISSLSGTTHIHRMSWFRLLFFCFFYSFL